MAIDLRPKNGDGGRSRVLLSAENATAFRKLCQFTEMKPDELMEELICSYVKSEKLPINVVPIGRKR